MKKHWYKVCSMGILTCQKTDCRLGHALCRLCGGRSELHAPKGRGNANSDDQEQALLAAIKEYDANKWKAIGQKLGKPAKVRSTRSLMSSAFRRLTVSRHASNSRRKSLEAKSDESSSLKRS